MLKIAAVGSISSLLPKTFVFPEEKIQSAINFFVPLVASLNVFMPISEIFTAFDMFFRIVLILLPFSFAIIIYKLIRG